MTDLAGVRPGDQSRALWLSTIAFTVCFAVWTIFSIIGVQIKNDLGLNETQFGLLVGTPVLTGSLIRPMLVTCPSFSDHRIFEILPFESERHMRRSNFSAESQVAIIRACDREPGSVVAKRHKITPQAIYIWKKRLGALDGNGVRRLKQPEAENARLKKLVAERDLEIEVMKEIAARKW